MRKGRRLARLAIGGGHSFHGIVRDGEAKHATHVATVCRFDYDRRVQRQHLLWPRSKYPRSGHRVAKVPSQWAARGGQQARSVGGDWRTCFIQ